jgi:tetratricopeptide (TPR) repeat protein
MKNGLLWQIEHTPNHTSDEAMASYVAGRCTATERTEIEEHCLNCEDCRAKLAVMLRVCFGEKREEEERELEPLFSLGLEAAALARWQFSDADAEPSPGGEPSVGRSHEPSSSWYPGTILKLANRGHKSYLKYAAAIALLLTLGIVSYLAYSSSSRPGDSLAMTFPHRQSRLLEARVTGGFAYQPYQRQRGEAEDLGVDRDQFNYVLADLTHAVASHPTTESRHALGRLYLLLGNLDRAEEQLWMAIQSAPEEANLHADIASLYYERSKYSDSMPLLSKAIDHFDTAIKLDPQLQEAWFNRALCHEKMGHFDQARADWEHYLQLDPNSPWGTEARERLRSLQEQERTGKSTE